MSSSWRLLILATFASVAGLAATLQFSGTTTSSTIPGLTSGDAISGSINITSSSLNSPFNISIGSVSFTLPGLGTTTFDAGNPQPILMAATQGSTDSLTVRVGSTVLLLNLFGGADFIPALPDGTDGAAALDLLDINQFLGGNLTLFSLPSGNSTIFDDNIAILGPGLLPLVNDPGNNTTTVNIIKVPFVPPSATFFINDVSRVPEPSTIFAVAAGGLVILLKRRYSR
jgi:hypothetical protein